jgi:hypothetical protein
LKQTTAQASSTNATIGPNLDPTAPAPPEAGQPRQRPLDLPAVVGPFDLVNESVRSAVLHTVKLDGTGLRRLSQPGIDGGFEDYLLVLLPPAGT